MTGNACCGPRREKTGQRPPLLHLAAPRRPSPAARKPREQVTLPGGVFAMGDAFAEGYHADAERPVREVRVRPFRIDATAVTNADFAAFADATGYTTEAERFGSSYVFHLLLAPGAEAAVLGRLPQAPWWLGVRGASWRAPEGPGSGVDDRPDHPVVHVSHNDALAYCAWAGTRLPTEAEWEYAARGGAEGLRYPWGNELTPGGREMCNIWRGTFPTRSSRPGGRTGTVPVTAYEPNGFGLHNVSGNVWEWCADWFAPGERLIRGGSYLCHASYCNRYRVAARSHNTPDSSTGHGGFRCATDLPHSSPQEGTRP
ncbi:formylglycine-generating enzyme family protein [Streptomyces sp. 6N223]|uniref:formylglycine-generating enzyme family protein n=1 Tax=Streptomyces sp. 6N223 TaxID=3457412 RepID=UPI003FD1B39F